MNVLICVSEQFNCLQACVHHPWKCARLDLQSTQSVRAVSICLRHTARPVSLHTHLFVDCVVQCVDACPRESLANTHVCLDELQQGLDQYQSTDVWGRGLLRAAYTP